MRIVTTEARFALRALLIARHFDLVIRYQPASCHGGRVMDRRADESTKIMTIEREFDPDATVEMPRPVQIDTDLDEEEVDPEQTLVREDWETTVIRRVAPHVAAVQSSVAEDSAAEDRFGWETEGLRRLSRVVTREHGE
jgi:hypothetical protein